jgi:hypothetical protein
MVKKTSSDPYGRHILWLINTHKFNKAYLAGKMGLTPGAFKNKLSEKQSKYEFTGQELIKLKAILRDIAADIKTATK